MTLISAHRCGPAGDPRFENTRAGAERAVAGDAEYVEFDVQRCADGALVLCHDEVVSRDGQPVAIETLTRDELVQAAGEICSYEEALILLAGRKLAHIDLKFTSATERYDTPERTDEVRAAQLAREIMGDDGFIITSLEDRSVRAVRDWADSAGLAVPVGLSLGRGLTDTPLLERPAVRAGELAPDRRIAASRANLVVAHHRLAWLGVARWAAGRGLPLLVWTVDEPRSLRRWLRDPRVWLLTSNSPQLACQIRAETETVSAPR
jgi:glycerophosphoryl diester phosphodiesterase